jgi:hypothetical protein
VLTPYFGELPDELLQLAAPAARHLAQVGRFPDGRVDHDAEQLGLARDVAVQRHLGEAEIGGDPLHGDRLDAVGVGDRDGRSDDRGQRQCDARLPVLLVGEVPEIFHAPASCQPGLGVSSVHDVSLGH